VRSEAAPATAAGDARVDRVVLDAELQRADPRRFKRLLAGFAGGYATMFHGDEAESPARWAQRIAGRAPPQPLMRIALAVQGSGEAEQVIGGAACEFYRASSCVLCSYLYVLDRPELRQRGHARALLEAAVQACAALGPVHAVVAEVEWPPLLPATRFAPPAVEGAQARLRFFARLGARRVALDYVQPALGADRQPVPWLRLMLLPLTQPADEAARRASLGAFLAEFHAALAQDSGHAVDTELLASQRSQLALAQPLTQPLH
jgi:GNAT superfamily N-acetyltransferase